MNNAFSNEAIGCSVRDTIDRQADAHGKKPYLIATGQDRSYSFAECRQRINAIVSCLEAEGVRPGEPVGYAFSNSIDGALTILALLYGGYLATAINLVAGESTIEYVLGHAEAGHVIVDGDSRGMVTAALGARAGEVSMLDLDALTSHHGADHLPGLSLAPPALASADGLLMYTSGTTGRPKGVVHTHESLLCGGRNTAIAHGLTDLDRGLCILPFYHINAFCVSLMASLVSGSSLVIPPKFSVSSFWASIRDHQCTWFSVVPTQISYLLHQAENQGGNASGCEHLRFGRSASAPLSPEVHAAFEKRFNVPVIETMGLTETAAQILSNPQPPGIRKIGSPGIAFGNEIIIGGQDQQEMPRGEEGEILVRGPNVLKCYLKNEQATREAVTPDGWLKTGDLGRMDEEGYVFVTGRLKELIIKGGENIAPREVDEALYSHPDVIEAAAFGVACENYGQRVEAGVKLSEHSVVRPDDLMAHCRKQIGHFKAPDQIHFLPDLPKGPSGKIQRKKLSELVRK